MPTHAIGSMHRACGVARTWSRLLCAPLGAQQHARGKRPRVLSLESGSHVLPEPEGVCRTLRVGQVLRPGYRLTQLS